MNNLSLLTSEEIRDIIREELSEFQPIQMNPEDRFIDKTECAELLGGVCLSTVDNLRRRGVLPSYKVGSNVRFRRSEVIQAIQDMNGKKERDGKISFV